MLFCPFELLQCDKLELAAVQIRGFVKRNFQRLALIIGLTILSLGLGATLVFGQGGSGRAPQGGSGRGSTRQPSAPKRPTPKRPNTVQQGSAAPATPQKTVKANPYTDTINGVKLELTLVPAGTFTMGSPVGEGYGNEKPQHLVTVQGFYMGKYEITQEQWQVVMGTNPSRFKGNNLPVEQVSWNDALEFIRKLNSVSSRYIYRLPTESEWEYACRAGTTTPFAFGWTLSSQQANFDGNYPYGNASSGVNRQQTTPVGSFAPNGFGLYDMHGNIYEWCQDWISNTYDGAPSDGSAWGNSSEGMKTLRGGTWKDPANGLRCAYRSGAQPDTSDDTRGLRVVAVARTQ